MTSIFTNTFKSVLAVEPTLMDFAQVEMVLFANAASLGLDPEGDEELPPVIDSPYAAIDTIAGLEAVLGWGPSIPQTATRTLPAIATATGSAPVTYFALMSDNLPFKLPTTFPTSLVKAIAFVYKGPQGTAVGHFTFPGTAGNYLTVPDSNPLDISPDITIVAKVRMSDWTPAAEAPIMVKRTTTTDQAYRFRILTDGRLRARTSPNGTDASEVTYTSSANISATTVNTWLWVAVTIDGDAGGGNRSARFWTSLNGSTWTELGVPQTTAGTTTIAATTAPVQIGGDPGTTTYFPGDIGYLSIRNAIGAGNTVNPTPGASEVFLFNGPVNLVGLNPAVTTFTATTSQTVTISRSGSPGTALITAPATADKVMFITDTPVGVGAVMRAGDGVIPQEDPTKGRILISWAGDQVIEGPLVREVAPPPFEPARTQHVWIYPMRTNMIANPSFEEDTDYWRSSGAKSQVTTKLTCTVRAATIASLAALSGTMTVDTVALIAGDRVLVKNQPVLINVSTEGTPATFGAVATPYTLPVGGLLPVDWDGPGRPKVATQVLQNEAMYFDRDGDTRDGHLFQYVTTANSPTGWRDIGVTAVPMAPLNGVYVVAAGAWTRATDANSPTELEDLPVYVRNGSQRSSAWQCTASVSPIVVDTTPLVFVQAVASGGGNFAGHFDGKIVESNMFPLITRYNETGWTIQMRVRSDGEVKIGFVSWEPDFLETASDWGHPEELWLPNDGWLFVRTCRSIGETTTGMLRLETQGSYMELDMVCAEFGTMPSNYEDWPYFDGDTLYATAHDYSWYERPHKSYSCWYDNRDAVIGRLFDLRISPEDAAPGGVFTDEEAAAQGLAQQWVPAGTPLMYWTDVLYPGDPKRPLPPVTGSVLAYRNAANSNLQGVTSPWAAREAIAGTPGVWGPVSWTAPAPIPPASVAALQNGFVKPTPSTRWTPGQYVQTGTVGIPGRAWWSGTVWVEGAAVT